MSTTRGTGWPYVSPAYPPDDEPDDYGVRAGEDYPGCPA